MKIRLLTTIAGHRNFWPAGTLYECPPDEADRLIAARQAVAVEAAAVAPPEQATLARPPKRTRKPTEKR